MHFSTTLHLLHHPVPAGTVFGLQCLQKSNFVLYRRDPEAGTKADNVLNKTKKRERYGVIHWFLRDIGNSRGDGGESLA